MADLESAVVERFTTDQPGALVRAWVVVAEVVDEHDDVWLEVATSEDLTAWGRDGMLTHAAALGSEDDQED